MGLIKTGLALAGGYGLIKAASKAAHEYQDKKDKSHSRDQPQSYPNQQHNLGHNQQMGYLYPDQMSHASPRSQSRAVESQTKDEKGAPPPYHQHGSAQEYYTGRVN